MQVIEIYGINQTNKALQLRVADEPAFGACHKYEVAVIDKTGLELPKKICDIQFQTGPVQEAGVNGITHEALLSIVIHRLTSFQSGSFACRENAVALTHIESALMWLEKRTRDRIKRNVEGLSVP